MRGAGALDDAAPSSPAASAAAPNAGTPAPRPLTAVKSLPARFNPDGASPAAQKRYADMLAAEAPTYNWLWQVVRNM
jgi:hypothetical protein